MKRRGNDTRRRTAAVALLLSAAIGLNLTGCGQRENGEEVSGTGRIPVSSADGVGEDAAGTQEHLEGTGNDTAGREERPDESGDDTAGTEQLPDSVEGATGGTKVTLDGAEYDIRWTKVTLDGVEYDLTERCASVNAISGIQEIEGYWVVHGHIGPRGGWYGFYNRETGQWEKEILGCCIAWDDPFLLDSIVYTMDNEVYDSDGSLIGRVDLDPEEYEYVWSLTRKGSRVEVEILNAEVESRVVTIDLS